MRTTEKVHSGGKVNIPKRILDHLGVEQGDLVEIDVRPVEGGDD